MKIEQLNSKETFLSIYLIYNINKANVPYRHKHEIFSEKVVIFHEFSLIIKKSASNLVCMLILCQNALAAILKGWQNSSGMGWQNSPGYSQAQYLNFTNNFFYVIRTLQIS